MNQILRVESINKVDSKKSLKNFDCGNEQLNTFFTRYSLRNDKLGIGKTFVCLNDKDKICGYFTLSTAQVLFEDFSVEQRLKLPKYPIPALRIARFAISKDMQGNGIGRWLLSEAFRKIVQVVEITGLYVVIVDAKEESKSFYEHYGFIKFFDKELTYFLPIETIKKAMYSK